MMNSICHAIVLVSFLIWCIAGTAWGAAGTGDDGKSLAGPVVKAAERQAVSPPLAELAGKALLASTPNAEPREVPKGDRPKAPTAPTASRDVIRLDPAVQRSVGEVAMPAPVQNFEGINNIDGFYPPDTVGAVGPNHYVQMVNVRMQVFNKSGAPQFPTPVLTNTIWAPLGGVCATNNDGDPIVVYDRFADRWVISQFAVPGGVDGYHECIAVSQTPDPTGAWHLYDFKISDTKMNDYPKLGVWPDGYYMSVNQFTNGADWGGAGAVVFERDKMLAGQAARMVYFDVGTVTLNFFGMLPSDVDGASAPPAGAPNVFVEFDDDSFGFPADQLSLWEFHVDWTTPANSTFGANSSFSPNATLTTAPFDSDLCGYARSCIPQPGTTAGLDAISDRLMFRLAYRNFGDHQSMVVNHTVDENGADHAGIRWYELRKTTGAWSIHQQGTYAPDADHRWMGSIAMDKDGNMALGYSVASGTLFPSIRYAGRLSSDPAGTLPQAEQTMITGSGSQTGTGFRWGDYSTMTIDPSDDCTFWYTQEYYQTTSTAGWQTRIGSFKFPSCTSGPTGTLTGTVTNAAGGTPIPGVTVTAGANSTVTDASGVYTFPFLPVATYTVTAQKYGFTPSTANGVTVTQNLTTTRDFSLTQIPQVAVSGTVTDGSGHGWPLFATIDIVSTGFSTTVTTNPITGAYSVNLLQGVSYTFTVTASGYQASSRGVTPPAGGSTQNFALVVSTGGVCPPGFQSELNPALNEQFSGGTLPANWSVVDNTNPPTGNVWVFNDPNPRSNLTGGTGSFAIADSDFFVLGSGDFDSDLRTPVMNFTGKPSVSLQFKTDFNWYSLGLDEQADVDVSVNGAAGPWTNVWHKSGSDYPGPVTETVDISAIAGNQANVVVRFHYYNANFEFWWQVDDVLITTSSCQFLAGGLVSGTVRDANTATGIGGATVSANTGQSTPTNAAPAGSYALFLPAGSYTLTASAGGYQNGSSGVTVTNNTVTSRDFSLAAGRLVPTPATFTLSQSQDSNQNYSLSLANSGGVSASFSLDQQAVLGTVIDTSGPPNPWATIANLLPSAVSRPAGAAVNGKFYVIGGEEPGDVRSGLVQRYTPSSGLWDTTLAAMPSPVSNICAAVVGTDIYIPGGYDGLNALSTMQVLHTASGIWETVATDPLPAVRLGAACASFNNRVYVFGGSDGTDRQATAWVYNPAATAGSRWSVLANAPMAGAYGAAVTSGSTIYYTGIDDVRNVFAYNPAANSWTEYPSLNSPRGGAGVWVLDNVLYVGGGGFTTYLSTMEQYDLSLGNRGAWTYVGAFQAIEPIANKPSPHRDAGLNQGRRTFAWATDSVTGRLFAAAGYNGTFLDSAEESRIAPASWLSLSPLQGNVPAAGAQPVTVTVQTTGLTVGAVYRARIALMGNTPYGIQYLPVTLTVTAPVPDATPPTVDTFSAVQNILANYLQVNVTAFSATDNKGVTGYFINETGVKPAAGAAGWSGTAPSTYTATSLGAKTLFGFAKDAAGNVSNGKSFPITINGPVRNGATTYATLQNAYNAIIGSATLQAWATTFAEPALLFNRNVAVAFDGGYDTAYAPTSAFSTLNGTLTIGLGSMTVDQLTIR